VAIVTARPARAHVQPSVDDNNRYIKVQPFGDRIRLAYTVFFGEVPGAGMRPQIDTNHDKTISEAEAQAFGEKLAAEVAANLTVELDGAGVRVTWSEIAVGMGSPQVAAGTFSVDLVAWVCASRGEHHLALHDRFRVLRPGETELKVEDSPGVAIAHARIGATDDPQHDFKFVGPGGPISDDGLDLVYTASDRAPVIPDVVCASAAGGGSSRTLVAVLVGLGIAGLAGGVYWFVRR
jgi:hypothetical protein